jgi:FkbM family methyltransferase
MTQKTLRARIRQARVRPWRYLLRRVLRPRVVSIGGVKMQIDPSRIPFSIRKALYHADFEAKERLIVETALRPGDRVLEGGAGMGLVSITAAKIAGDGNVTSYEPTPDTYALLNENIAANAVKIECRNRALGPRAGTMKFGVRRNLISSRGAARGDDDAIEVRVDGIAEALAETRANVLILDVEGKEVEIIEACPLERLELIVMEIHPGVTGHEATSRMIARMLNAGFVWRRDLSHEAAMTFMRMEARERGGAKAET